MDFQNEERNHYRFKKCSQNHKHQKTTLLLTGNKVIISFLVFFILITFFFFIKSMYNLQLTMLLGAKDHHLSVAMCWLFWTTPIWVLVHVWKMLVKSSSKQKGNYFFCLHCGLSSSSSSGVVKAKRLNKSIIVCKPEDTKSYRTSSSSSDGLLLIPPRVLCCTAGTEGLSRGTSCCSKHLHMQVSYQGGNYCSCTVSGHVNISEQVHRGGIFSSENDKPANLPRLLKKQSLPQVDEEV